MFVARPYPSITKKIIRALFFGQNIKLGIVGMQGSGKTQLFSSLKGEPYNKEYTDTMFYPKIKIKYKGRKYNILAEKDIKSGDKFVENIYEHWLEDKDLVMMVFDINKYINDPVYQSNTNNRFEFIYNHKNKAKVVILGSHLDMFDGDKETAKEKIKSIIEGKSYKTLLNSGFFVKDLRDIDSVRDVIYSPYIVELLEILWPIVIVR